MEQDRTAKIKVPTSELNNLSRKYSILEDQLNETQAKLVADVVETVSTYTPLVEDLADIIADLDVFTR